MNTSLTWDTVRGLLPPRAEDAHKGSFGHLLILAGALGYAGAAKLACHAAERSGAGLVTLGLPEPLLNAMSVALTETMTLALPATDAGSLAPAAVAPALEASDARQAVALGPGLGQHPGTADFVRGFVPGCAVPLLVDADALNLLAGHTDLLGHRAAPTILTPHPGEMARLCGSSTVEVQAHRADLAMQQARAWNTVVVLKGSGTVVAAPDGRYAVNTTGNHGLAKGGSGDVLAGLIGGLLAQRMHAYDAACLGVFLHGVAGDLAMAQHGARGMVAGDVIAAIPAAWHALERGA